MAGKSGRNGKAQKAYYAGYDYVGQKRKRLNRQLKLQPNNEQIKTALKNISEPKGGKIPNNKNGWVDRKGDAFQVHQWILTTGDGAMKHITRGVLGRSECRRAANVFAFMNAFERKLKHESEFGRNKLPETPKKKAKKKVS